MPDGSFSWDQPDSKGFAGWEGFCGQTAIANLLSTHEGVNYPPRAVGEQATDSTPGTQPSTLMRAIGKLSDPNNYQMSHNPSILTLAAPRNPIACLLAWEGSEYHYVTVIRVRNKTVYFNHWGLQDSLPEAEFKRRWGFKNKGIASRLAAAAGSLRPYTSIRRK